MQEKIDKKQKLNQYPRLSVAPMLDWTDRHCRYLHRLLSRHALLYTEMVTTGALLHGDVARHLRLNAEEHPVAFDRKGDLKNVDFVVFKLDKSGQRKLVR